MVSPNEVHVMAQGGGAEDWVSLIILIVLTLASAVGGLIKRRAEARRQGEQTGPVPKPRQTANWRRRLEEELERVRHEGAPRGEEKAEQDRPSRPPAGTGDQSRLSRGHASERERLAREAVAAAKEIRREVALQAPEPAPEPVAAALEPQAGRVPVPAGSKALVDLTGPEALRRAIIQYEILGKPLGLRDLLSDDSSSRIY